MKKKKSIVKKREMIVVKRKVMASIVKRTVMTKTTGKEEEEEEDDAAGGASEAVLHDKSEKDVEFAGLAFLCLIEEAINDTKKGLNVSIVQKQNVRSRTRSVFGTIF